MKFLRKRMNREGNALVELVVGFPILFLITFGSIEACNLNHLQQCATEASYQGGLSGIPAGVVEADIRTMMNAMLDARNIENATIIIEGLDGTPYDNLVTGEKFQVTTIIPASDNLAMIPMICSLNDLRADRVSQKN